MVESLEIEFNRGTTSITGETGAGKSLVLDALGMALGDRADTDTIRHGKDRAEITATFDLTGIENASSWLVKNDFENAATCLLRRIYTREGRSKGYINGQPSTMSQLQELGEMLTDIHSQHEHQSLLRKDTHRRLLDEYAEVQSLSMQVTAQFNRWQQVRLQLDTLVARLDEVNAKKDLLSFQVNELKQIDVSVAHLEQLAQEQSTLANAEQILQDSHNLLAICEQAEDVNLCDNMNRALSILANMPHKPAHLLTSEELLKSSLIQIEEAVGEIKHHVDRFDADPYKLQMVEEELAVAFQLARKHRVSIDQLEAKNMALIAELDALVNGNENINFLQQSLDELANNYEILATKLSKKRSAAAVKMASQINQKIHMLAMDGAELVIQLTPRQQGQYHANGLEKVEFLLTTNAGQPHKPLSKIASGGELSRVSLAIQVVAAGHSKISTLVFDEVDVGIGGSTADVVGRLLKALGERGQVISVTHQPQVAVHAHHHYLASKITKKGQTASLMVGLDPSQRVNELARMLGGATVTKQTLSHAAELLSLASS